MAFYPKIANDQWMQFKVVVENMLKDPEYLKSEDCPYNQTFIDFLMKLRPPEVADIFHEADEGIVIDSQLRMIINDLEAMGPSMAKADSKDRIDYFKAKTSMFDKLIAMRERNNTIKEMNDFKTTILQFMDDVLTKDQITELMRRVDEVA